MIDSHCHLEQKDYNKDIEEIISKCKKEMKALITSCAHPKNFDFTIELVKKYPKFIFASFGIHPEYIKEITDKEIDEYIQKIRDNKEYVSGIGEIGLDYHWIKEPEFREKQKELFKKMISLAEELNLPIIIHSRGSDEDVLEILKYTKLKVYWHMFGNKNLIEEIQKKAYYIGIGPLILRSKVHRKIVKTIPLDKILLETDSPWFGVPEDMNMEKMFKVRGYPWNIKYAAQKIAKERNISFEEVWEQCGKNTIKFFNLNL